MASRTVKSARTVAVAALNKFDPQRNYASSILNKLLAQTDQKPRASDLVFGSIRNRSAIDMVISRLADCPVERIAPKLLNIIRIGAYELIYCPATAEYSIVNEAAESVKRTAGKKQTGFVNAVLRQIARDIKNRQIPLSDANTKSTLPQTFSSGCEFNTSFLPEPKLSPADYFSSAFSLPKWLVSDWLAEFGFEKTLQICFAGNRRPSIYLRANRLKTATQELAEMLHHANIDCEIADDSMIKIKAARAITELPGFAEGLFSVQDITASQAVRLLEPQPSWTILDLCAAPGTKTAQLAELTDDKTKIVATDIDGQRLEKVRENVNRLGLKSVSVVGYEQLERTYEQIGSFDAVLLDVPCSNTGVLAKRIEVRYRIKQKTIVELTKIQGRLLQTAAAMIKPQGRICYSTCSIEGSENSRLVRQFLQKNRGFKLESELLTLPSAQSFDHDGGYIAIIVKNTKLKV